MHSDYKIPPRDKVMEEENYSESPCRQGNGLKRGTITFEVDINKKCSFTSEVLNARMAVLSKGVPALRHNRVEKAGRATRGPNTGTI